MPDVLERPCRSPHTRLHAHRYPCERKHDQRTRQAQKPGGLSRVSRRSTGGPGLSRIEEPMDGQQYGQDEGRAQETMRESHAGIWTPVARGARTPGQPA